MKDIHIIGGGTFSHIRNHLALATPAFGKTARDIRSLCERFQFKLKETMNLKLFLTKMADPENSQIETNEDVSQIVDAWVSNSDTKIIFFNVALTDYSGEIVNEYDIWQYPTRSGKYEHRLKTSEGSRLIRIFPQEKILKKIRKNRKDIFLVAFKTTCGATEDEQFTAGLQLLKDNSCNLVLANDTKTRVNMVITPEQARYSVTTDRQVALATLVDMALARSQLTFTRSTVVEGDSVKWDSEVVHSNFKKVVDYCVSKGGYKSFKNSTVGHFAMKVNDKTFLTSKRKANYNDLNHVGLVKVESSGYDSVIAYGAKPSVGGMSQRMIFSDHPEMDCIVHFHCPLKPGSKVNVRPQKYLECGSHECGQNTSNGLQEDFPGIKCVYLDNHGPNIVFHHSVDPDIVIKFIDHNFDLSQSTDGIKREGTSVPTL